VKALDNISLAFEKIVQNAVEAMNGKGGIEVNINRIKDQNMVEIRFIDQGSGIRNHARRYPQGLSTFLHYKRDLVPGTWFMDSLSDSDRVKRDHPHRK
jgi:anti-sigma regulatory factor (Ser/Thr protein kinase)